MTPRRVRGVRAASFALSLALTWLAGGAANAAPPAPAGPPDATIDLATREGAAVVRAAWRYSDARIVEVGFRAPGADRKPSGPPNTTNDITPHAGDAGFDDSAWPVIDPASLDERRSTGKVCFNWYRTRITIPERIGEFDPTGATVVFDIVVDDYAEVWVDGALPRDLGQHGGSVVGGWNAHNRVVIARGATPGQEIQLAVFGMNGPISAAPDNFIWVRSAKLDFYAGPRSIEPRTVALEVDRRDPAIDALVPRDAKLEKLAEGFVFTEGPVWSRDGYLLFSDPNENTIYQWTPAGALSVFRANSGYAGEDIAEYRQPGSNGLAFDRDGRLTICEHGNRRVSRIESDGTMTTLAERFDGKRLNSPNDLVYRSDGALYFTDPPFGLPKFDADPRKELPHSGVFCLRDGRLQLVSTDFAGPNGLAFSPDEKFLYVCNWDTSNKVVMRYAVDADGSLAEGIRFFDMTGAPGEEALDGIKADRAGNLYVSGPGGVWIISAAGKHLGTLVCPELPANFAWGDADGRTLYLTARTGLYRIRMNVPGAKV
ncbi:MAG: SMP-30/gluconolactonase/LRE family protein [bacterium]